MNVLVTGATGDLGAEVVRAALAAGHRVRALVRAGKTPPDGTEAVVGDVVTGAGLAAAVTRADAIVHAASEPRNAAVVDVEGTRNLLAAAAAAGVGHFLYVSIVGIDRIPWEYYRHKLAAERLVEAGGVPWSILRVSQFHSFVDARLGALDRLPLVLAVPSGFRVQSIATSDVALALCSALAAGPGGRLPDLAGPEAMSLVEAARIWVEVLGRRKAVVSFPLPGRAAAAFRRGFNTVPERPGGTVTWREWLERRAGRSPAAARPAAAEPDVGR